MFFINHLFIFFYCCVQIHSKICFKAKTKNQQGVISTQVEHCPKLRQKKLDLLWSFGTTIPFLLQSLSTVLYSNACLRLQHLLVVTVGRTFRRRPATSCFTPTVSAGAQCRSRHTERGWYAAAPTACSQAPEGRCALTRTSAVRPVETGKQRTQCTGEPTGQDAVFFCNGNNHSKLMYVE